MALIEILGYAPDAPTDTPGVLTNCSSFVPSMKGYEGAPTPASLGVDALAAACKGASIMLGLSDTARFIAGTATKLYELSSTSWTDRTRASGGNYGLASDGRWTFAQFGSVSLAATKTDTIQYSASGAFANLTGAPKAAVIETVGQFVLAFDTDEATYGDQGHRWWCCAKGDYTNWTPAVSTECATGLITSSPGKIKAAKRFGETIIVYKERSMFLGAYVGPAVVWDFREIHGEVGALSAYAVVNIGTRDDPKHIFMGSDSFYMYDGTRPLPIGEELRETVYGELNRSYAHLVVAAHDEQNARVYFFYPTSTELDKCVVYHYKKNKWGRDDRSIEMAVQYANLGVTYDGLGSLFSTYNDLPAIAYDSPFWTARTRLPAIFDTNHTVKSLTGASTSSSMTTGDFGDENVSSCISRISPRFFTKPTSANMVNFYRRTLGDSLTEDQTTAMNSLARFDVMREDFWHRVRLDFTGPVELNAINPNVIMGGDE